VKRAKSLKARRRAEGAAAGEGGEEGAAAAAAAGGRRARGYEALLYGGEDEVRRESERREREGVSREDMPGLAEGGRAEFPDRPGPSAYRPDRPSVAYPQRALWGLSGLCPSVTHPL
jgi:hypothetical protein